MKMPKKILLCLRTPFTFSIISLFIILILAACVGERQDDIGESNRLSQLRRELKDEDNHVRARAVTALGRLHDPAMIPLIKEVLSDSDPRVRAQAARALGEIGGPAVLETLELALEDGRGVVRQEAVEALARQDDPTAVRILENTLLYDNDLSVRILAAQGLSRSKSDGAMPALRKALPSSMKEDLYSISLELTNLLNEHRAGSGTAIVRDMLKSEEPAIRLHAADVQAGLDMERGVAELKKLLRHSDPAIRIGAVNAIVRLRDPGLIPLLRPLETDADESVSARAKWSIETLSGDTTPKKKKKTVILAP